MGLSGRVLVVAGSDSGGGAGIQADLKAFARCGAHGMSAIVALTAQNTVGVQAIHEAPPSFVRAQIDAVLDDIGADAAKTGMLFSAPLIEAVADALATRGLPLVVDPVMVASSGATLLRPDAVAVLVRRLFPLATVVTPNLGEAQALTQTSTEDRAELAERGSHPDGNRSAPVAGRAGTGGTGAAERVPEERAVRFANGLTARRDRATSRLGCKETSSGGNPCISPVAEPSRAPAR